MARTLADDLRNGGWGGNYYVPKVGASGGAYRFVRVDKELYEREFFSLEGKRKGNFINILNGFTSHFADERAPEDLVAKIYAGRNIVPF